MSVLMERMCRTCMIAKGNGNNRSREQEMTSLTSLMGDKRIIDILRESIPMLKLDLHIKLPKIICCECREKLKEWCEFQRRCLRVEHHLKELLEAPRKSDDDSDSLLEIFESDSRDEDDTLLKAKMEGNCVFEEEFIDQEIDSDDDLLDVDDSEDDLIESCCSDTSIDFILDEESDMEER